MKLARAIHFDESDSRVYNNPARTGEWCISGGFEFSDWTEADLEGKADEAEIRAKMAEMLIEAKGQIVKES